MTNDQILEHAARVNYAYLQIDKRTHISPGLENWHAALAELTPRQRVVLIARIVHFDCMLNREEERTEG